MFSMKHRSSQPCLAPFNSLFFSMTGKAYYCLANRNAVLGSYPAQSVDEIVSGDLMQQYRIQFIKEKFIEGCEQCKQHLTQGTEAAAFINFHKAYPLLSDYRPRYIDFELDNRCNLNCIMCSPYFSSSIPYSDGVCSNYKSPYDDAFFTAFDKYAPALIKAHFRGGEPFLISRYHDFWERLRSINHALHIGATTNATVLSTEHRRMLERGNFDLNVSLDSLQTNTYEKIRIGATFSKYKEHLDYFISLNEQGKINLSACMCLMSLNWQEFPDLFRFCNQHDIVVYINYVEVPEYLSIKKMNKAKIEMLIHCFEKEEISGKGRVAEVNRIVFATMLGQLRQWASEAPAKRQNAEEILALVQQKKETFFVLLNAFLLENSQFARFDKVWFERQINALKSHELPGFQIDLVYFSLLDTPIPEIVKMLPELSQELLNRKILDKYLYVVNMMKTIENDL